LIRRAVGSRFVDDAVRDGGLPVDDDEEDEDA